MDGRRRTALLVEGDDATAAVLAQTMERQAIEFIRVHSHREAKRVLGVTRFDLVVSEVTTDAGNLDQLTQALSELPEKVELVLLSELETPFLARLASLYGARYLKKPLALDAASFRRG